MSSSDRGSGWLRKFRILPGVVRPGRREDRYFECRDCGTRVEDDERVCSACGSKEIAGYEI
jgi:rubrerythrin